ncbi:MAG: AraC family transcriptional regulator [Bacteroidales bacterium]|nr:AraC family transcriptional regulator [Bacteroidales bacterium]
MKKRIPMVEWRERINQITPAEYRIGNNLLYIEQHRIPDMAYEPWKTDVTTAVIYTKGSVEVSINMKRYTVKAPAMVIMLAEHIMQLHNTSDDLESTCLVMSKSFSDELFSNFSKTTSLYNSVYQNPVLQFGDTDRHVITDYLRMLKSLITFTDNPYRLEAAKHLTLTLFFGYFHKFHNADYNNYSYANTIVIDFISMLKQNYKQHRDANFYAEKLCLTPKYLSTLIKEHTGKTLHEWIDEYVTTESKALLRSTKITIDQISNNLNFPSQDTFSKFFKRVVGISPSEYRKKW